MILRPLIPVDNPCEGEGAISGAWSPGGMVDSPVARSTRITFPARESAMRIAFWWGMGARPFGRRRVVLLRGVRGVMIGVEFVFVFGFVFGFGFGE